MPASGRKFAVVASALGSDARQAPTLARKAGFSGLLFDAFSSELNVSDLSATGRREFRQVLSSQDRELVGFRADLGAKGFGPGGDVDQLLWQLKKILETAAGLVAPLVCIELGPLPEPAKETKPNPKITQDQAGLILLPTFVAAPAPEVTELNSVPAKVDPVFIAQVDGALAELGTFADRCNVTVAFRCDLASFAALERALAVSRCPWFGIDLDPVAILRDAWEMQEIFSRLGSLVRHVRARDAITGADRRTKPMAIGKGDVPWNQLFSDLDSADFHGWMTVDPMELPDRLAAAGAGLKYLKNGDW
jgi:sugar phosphate isomerase/epimerase